jgi:ethanolamine utilization cobalamin adenosyltransferase
MTHLDAQVLVEKTHPRIRFRGAIDTLEAELLLCQADAPEAIHKQLGEVLALARNLIRWDVLEEPAGETKLCGLDQQELRNRSHRPQDYYGQTHFMPSATDPKLLLQVNRARCLARSAELAAVEAFTDQNGKVCREDILRALNRMSSMLYLIMVQLKADHKE